jgi:hypothetical protein
MKRCPLALLVAVLLPTLTPTLAQTSGEPVDKENLNVFLPTAAASWNEAENWSKKEVPTKTQMAVVNHNKTAELNSPTEPIHVLRVGNSEKINHHARVHIRADFSANHIQVAATGSRGEVWQTGGQVSAKSLRIASISATTGGGLYHLKEGTLTINDLECGIQGPGHLCFEGSNAKGIVERKIEIGPHAKLEFISDQGGFPSLNALSDPTIAEGAEVEISSGDEVPRPGIYTLIATPSPLADRFKVSIIPQELKGKILEDRPGLVVEITDN